jgi:4,4'-diaponeurosporenoate glycosyltransferase
VIDVQTLSMFGSGGLDVVIYLLGWCCGWGLLWRPRPLPVAPASRDRSSVAVIVPARNEATALPHLVSPLVRQLRPGDELVVVDDHSTDDTARVATALGARVIHPPALPDGWMGKPHACWHGTESTSAATLLFLDADVRPAADLLDRIAAAVERHPADVVSVQPWHVTERPVEQASMLFNISALMGSGAFTFAGSRIAPRVAFGPVLAVRREVYDRFGGHSHRTIRSMHTEDIGIARAVGAARLFTGRPDTTFRMYPDGLLQAVEGWTRSIATGARYARWWLALATLAWIWSLAGGWLVMPWVYPLSAIQVWVLGRRAGSMHPLTALLYPLAVTVFAIVFVRSLVVMVSGRRVTWKGRRVDARPT